MSSVSLSGFKRPAGFQITKTSNDSAPTSSGASIEQNSEPSTEDNAATDQDEEDSLSRRKVFVKPISSSTATIKSGEPENTGSGFGFSAYANTNPFASALSSSSGFGAVNSNGSISTFGTFGSTTKSFQSKELKIETKPMDFITPTLTPSPKTDKINPFSSISPKLNPFMKIVDSKEEPFLERSNSQAAPTRQAFPVVPVKSFFTTFKDTKSVPAITKLSPPSVSTYPEEVTVSDQQDDQDEKQADEDGNDDGDDAVAEEDVQGPPLTKIYQLPENVVIMTGEENENCFMTFRAKLYRWVQKVEAPVAEQNPPSSSSDSGLKAEILDKSSSIDNSNTTNNEGSWVEVGVGPVRLLRETVSTLSQSSGDSTERKDEDAFKKSRIVMRREERKGGHGTKLLLNIPLQGYIVAAKQGDKAFRITCVHAESENQPPTPQVYVLKTKLSSEIESALHLIHKCIEEAKKVGY